MGVDKSKIGLTFRHGRESRDAQEAVLRAAGAEAVYHVGKQCDDWREAVRMVRPGDVVWVPWLAMVATDRKRGETAPSGQPAEVVMEIHERNAVLIECRTGRKSSDPKQRRAMIADAVRSLRQGGRKPPPSGQPVGRKRRVWPSPAVRDAALKIWRSRNIPSDVAAVRECKDTWPDAVSERMVRALGPSGRNKP